MELTTMQMYWLVTLDAINSAAIVAMIISIALVFGSIYNLSAAESKKEKYSIYKIINVLSAIAVIAGLFFTLIPSTKQMAAIIIVPKIANGEKVQTIGNKVYDLAVEWMNELKPSKKGE